jgi:hypothetical protein
MISVNQVDIAVGIKELEGEEMELKEVSLYLFHIRISDFRTFLYESLCEND